MGSKKVSTELRNILEVGSVGITGVSSRVCSQNRACNEMTCYLNMVITRLNSTEELHQKIAKREEAVQELLHGMLT